MNLKDNNTASLIVLVGVIAGLALLLTVQSNAAAAEAEKTGAKPLPLIDIDKELVGYVRQAEEMAAEKNYAGAIEILQTLLDRPEHCFVPTEDPRLFVSLATRVHEVIGQLPPEGMKLYRRLYDIKAGRMFRVASERFDESALRDIICRYLHTSYGDDALNLLGAIQFDRGEFSQAARCWQRILQAFGDKEEAVLMAKIAVAHHFAGESVLAAEAMKSLTERYLKTRATIGGREQNVAAFARRILAKPAPVVGPCLQHDWPCLTGARNSVAVMSPCRPVMKPQWTVPGGRPRDNPNIKAALSAIPLRGRGNMTMPFVSLSGGHVVFNARSGSRRPRIQETLMAALIHPIVVGTTVLYRQAGGVVAHDLLTGEKLWETLSFNLYRSAGTRCYSVRLGGVIENRGRWTLTAGDGKVFAVGKFLPWSTRYYYMAGGRGPIRSGDNSALAAFSITDQGQMIWRVGRGRGEDDVLRGGKYLGAPTCADGRVYTIIEHVQAHHLVCLNAGNGQLVWKVKVGQTPKQVPMHYMRGDWRSVGGPPAVADGRVFAVTNAGVISAFDAGTGRSLWAYQYDSSVNQPSDARYYIRPRGNISYPPNPVIVTKGRVKCLPADGKRLLALRTDTGKLDWSIDRQGQRDLTAVDSSRLLLSGKGLRIINAATGKNVWTGGKITGIHGRPAVTTDAILASGKGEIIRVSLKDFSVTRLPVKQPDAILGNLICVNGKLIAANAAGVSAYFPAASTRNNQE